MNRSNVLVVVVDGLRASALGAYGNTSFATPALDEFAAESFLLDFSYAATTELRDIYRALWHSVHPLRPVEADAIAPSLPQFFSSREYATTLVTDELELRSFGSAQHFDQCIEMASLAERSTGQPTSKDASQTALARLFAASCEQIESQPHRVAGSSDTGRDDSSQLIWMHSRGMYGSWDAPIDYQHALLDEGDPPPLESAAPPDFVLSAAEDPDVAFRYGCAYAAQVMVLDACWQGLMQTVAARSHERWLVVLLGARGFPLGEHRRIGGVDTRLYGEQLHVPFLVRLPDGRGRLARSAALASHADLLPTLAPRIDGAELQTPLRTDGIDNLSLLSNANASWREAILSTSPSSKSLRTDSWCFRQDNPSAAINEVTGSGRQFEELFVRPDDRWEANDVAKLCTDEVDTLARAADNISRQLSQNRSLFENEAIGSSSND